MEHEIFPNNFTEGFYAKLKYNTSYPDLFNWFNALSKANNHNFKILINNNDVYIQNKELKEYNNTKKSTSDFDETAKSIQETINGILKYSMDFSKECHENETFDEDILISIEKILKIDKNNKDIFDYLLDNTDNSEPKPKSIIMIPPENTSINVVIHKKIYRDLNSDKAIQFIDKMAIDNNLNLIAYWRSQRHEDIFASGYKIYDLCQLSKYKKTNINIDKFCCTANNLELSGKNSRHGKSNSNIPKEKKISMDEAEIITNEMIDIYLNEKNSK